MRGRRLRVVALFAAVAGLLAYWAVPAFAAAPDPPTGVTASPADSIADVGWVPGATNGSTVSGYVITPSPACGGCTGLTVTGATTTHSVVSGLTNGTPYTFTVHTTSNQGNSTESTASTAVTPNTSTGSCNFDSFPDVPGGSGELNVACALTTAVGAGGNQYRIEDFPQASWSQGEGRSITTSAATGATSKTITASNGHFTAQDVLHTIAGTGIPSNSFIVTVTNATTVVLNKAVGGTGVASGVKLTVNNTEGRTFTDAAYPTTTTITSNTAHFCKPSLSNCGQKNDQGHTISGTRITYGTTIVTVNSLTSITISQPTIACPSGVSSTNCNQVGISSPSNLASNRQIVDATYTSPNKVCSNTAGWNQTDVNMPIANVGAGKIPAGNYIASVSATCATLHANLSGTSTNANVVIGSPASSAPKSGDAAMELSSELSVFPGLAAGVPACSTGTASGSNLIGKWLSPGSFDKTSLGQPSASAIKGPMLGQYDVITGPGNPAFAGYVVPVGPSTAGDTDTAAHVDIVFPTLLTGIAVCPEPNDVGVATSFKFFGETLSQSAAGSGQVRSFSDLPFGSSPVTGTAYEHILKATTPYMTASGSCTDQYPTSSAGYACGGN